jgi:hypothetical protein
LRVEAAHNCCHHYWSFMTLRRQGFIAFLVLTAVVSVFFSPLLPLHGTVRHHARANIAVALSLASFTYTSASSSFAPTVPEKRVLFPQGLYELHCARLC